MIQGVELERPPGFETVSADIDNAQAWVLDPFVLPAKGEIADAFKGSGRNELSDQRFAAGQYEVLNREFVSALAGYLIDRAGVIQEGPDKPVSILEVGAGIGKLSRFLEFFFDEMAEDRINLNAVDTGEFSLTSALGPNVEQLDYEEGLRRYKPSIVICSWMPLDEDWTQAMRDTPSVQEYILIGEGSGGCCGAQWETWGNTDNLTHSMRVLLLEDEKMGDEERSVIETKIKELESMIPPSEADGFSRYPIEHLTDLQTGIHERLHSETVSFRRDTPA